MSFKRFNTNTVMQKVGLFIVFLFTQVVYGQTTATVESFRTLNSTEQRLNFLADSNIIKFDQPTYNAILAIVLERKDGKAEFFWHYKYYRFASHFKIGESKQYIEIIAEMLRIAEKNGLEAELIVSQWHKLLSESADNNLGEQDLYSVYLKFFEQIKLIGFNKFERYKLDDILKIIGCNFYALGDLEKGLECLFEAEKISQAAQEINAHQFTMILNTIQAIYAEAKNYPKAIVYAEKVYDLNLNYKYTGLQYWFGVFWQALASLDIAQYKLEMGDFKESEKYAERGYQLYKAHEDLKSLEKTVASFDALQVLVRVKLLLGKVDEVAPLLERIEFLKPNIDFSLEVNYFKPMRLYDNYYRYYEVKKDYTNAFRYLKLASDMKDSLSRRNDKRKLWQIESRVKTDNYITQLKAAEEEKYFQERLRNLAVGTLLVFTVFAIVFYKRIKKDNSIIVKQKSLLELSLVEKETLLKEIHHRVKNNLQIILGLFDKQARQVTDESTKQLIKAGQDRVFSIALVHQNLYQSENLTTIEIKEYLDLLTKNIEKSQKGELQDIKINLDVDDSVVDIDLAIPLGLILNELITNCYKYAFKDRTEGEIIIRFRQEKKHFLFMVQDNGVGLPENFDLKKSLSLGMNLVRGLVRQINGDLKVVSNTSGTVFTVNSLKNT
ncbi:MAG: sensor histidine kinase [Bacteroidetes bacterium]|nr:MAG: sensor histidine kinase [Bacteroidota bacterium]